MNITTANERAIITTIVCNVVRTDEMARRSYERATRAKVNGVLATREAEDYEKDGNEGMADVCKSFAESRSKVYRNNMRKARDIVARLTSIPEDVVRDVLIELAIDDVMGRLFDLDMLEM